jgi:hypothetical protein
MTLSPDLARLSPGAILVPITVPVNPVKTFIGQHGDGEPITSKIDCELEKAWPRITDGWVACFTGINGTFKLEDFVLSG